MSDEEDKSGGVPKPCGKCAKIPCQCPPTGGGTDN